MPKYCCEGQGFGGPGVVDPFPTSTCSNTTHWTLKPGSTDYSLCTQRCTRYICRSSRCKDKLWCFFNRIETCGAVPREWIAEHCMSLSRGQRQSIFRGLYALALAHALLYALLL